MAERYLLLRGKYVRDGSELFARGDYVQAGEKYWGAVATMVKVIATRRGLRHASHRDLGRVMKDLYRETNDAEYVPLFRSTERLHENFYEDRLGREAVDQFRSQAVQLIEKLSSLETPR